MGLTSQCMGMHAIVHVTTFDTDHRLLPINTPRTLMIRCQNDFVW